jgi:hypothetical protein
MRRWARVAGVLVVLGCALRANAQNVASSPQSPARTQSTPVPGWRTLELTGVFFSEAWDFNGRFGAALAAGTVAVALPVHGRWTVVLEGLAMDVDERRSRALLGGPSVLVRRYVAGSARTAWFITGGAGVSYASHPVPDHGTRFNYLLQAGGGVVRQFRPHVGGILDLRLFHLSNNSLNGSAHNPDFEALGGHVGLCIRF